MAERTSPPPGDRRPAIAGSIAPPAPPATAAAPPDPVEQEWERIERERVAGEIAEAHDDVVAAISTPSVRRRGTGVWWAFAAALLAGVVFAVAVNLFFMPTRKDPATGPSQAGPRPPSASEAGPGIDGPDEGESTDGPEPAVGA